MSLSSVSSVTAGVKYVVMLTRSILGWRGILSRGDQTPGLDLIYPLSESG